MMSRRSSNVPWILAHVAVKRTARSDSPESRGAGGIGEFAAWLTQCLRIDSAGQCATLEDMGGRFRDGAAIEAVMIGGPLAGVLVHRICSTRRLVSKIRTPSAPASGMVASLPSGKNTPAAKEH